MSISHYCKVPNFYFLMHEMWTAPVIQQCTLWNNCFVLRLVSSSKGQLENKLETISLAIIRQIQDLHRICCYWSITKSCISLPRYKSQSGKAGLFHLFCRANSVTPFSTAPHTLLSYIPLPLATYLSTTSWQLDPPVLALELHNNPYKKNCPLSE